MPAVPYQPFPTAEPSGRGAPSIGLSVPGAAFGTNIASATEGLGRTLEGVGGEIGQRAVQAQTLINEAEARDTDFRAMVEAGKAEAEYKTLTGKQAIEGHDAYIQNIKDIRQKYREGLTNPASQRIFDSSSQRFFGYMITAGAAHLAQEAKSYNVQAIDSQRQAAITRVGVDLSEGAFHQAIGEIEGYTRREGEVRGWPEAETQLKIDNATSAATATRLESLSRTDPFGARVLFERDKAMLLNHAPRIDNIIRTSENSKGAQLIADKATEGMTPDTAQGKLTEMVEKGKELADKQSPDNPFLKDYVETRIGAKFNQLLRQASDSGRADLNTVGQFILSHQMNDAPITDAEALKSDPEVWGAFTRMRPKQQDEVLKSIRAASARDAKEWSQEKQDRYDTLKGMDWKQLKDVNLYNEKVLPSWRTELLRKQAQGYKNAEADIEINRTVNNPVVRNMMINANLLNTEGKPLNLEDYNRFKGLLRSALETEEAREGKKPKNEMVEQLASKALRATIEVPGRLWGTNVIPIWQQEIPDEVKLELSKSLMRMGVQEPTDTDVRRLFMKLKLKQ